jgi:hypothetical protein
VPSLQDFKDHKIFIDLMYLADMVQFNGLSTTIPLTPEGHVSLPFALASICGFSQYPDVDDFFYLVDSVPAVYRAQFVRCWEAIELEVNEDIVEWSERVGTAETVRRLRSLSKEIQLS